MIAAAHRKEAFARLGETPLDLLVIGGGATGAGILLDAASRGMKALLLEQEDYAWGTSSRSTKLIHGGLRYLKQLEIGLVREVGRERAILHANAPHLVHPEELLLPLIESGSLGKYSTPVGLWMYEKLAGVPKQERFRTLSREETLCAEPLLNQRITKGSAVYREYRTDDARLVTALLATAADLGAESLNYARVESFEYDDAGQINGVKVLDRIDQRTHSIKAKNVVNAAGPWCDEVRKIDGPVEGKKLQLTKGVHLVFSHERFPILRSLYFDVPADGRMIFAVRRDACTYLGTTDTLYTTPIGQPRTLAEDADYLLAAANFMFPALNLSREDILSSWAGLRPLIYEEGKGPSELSRKDEVFQTPSGLISIAGGKLTGYRLMAERVMDMVMASQTGKHGSTYKESGTHQLPLKGGDFESYAAVRQYKKRLLGESRQIDLNLAQVNYLVNTYGTEASVIIERAYALGAMEREGQIEALERPFLRLLKAELSYSMDFEGVCTLSDFLIRRTGRLYFERPDLEDCYRQIAEWIAEKRSLSDEKRELQINEFEQAYYEVLSFPAEAALSSSQEH